MKIKSLCRIFEFLFTLKLNILQIPFSKDFFWFNIVWIFLWSVGCLCYAGKNVKLLEISVNLSHFNRLRKFKVTNDDVIYSKFIKLGLFNNLFMKYTQYIIKFKINI